MGEIDFFATRWVRGSASGYVGNVKRRLISADPEIDSAKLSKLPKSSYRSGDETISRIAANKGGYAVVAVGVKIYARVCEKLAKRPHESKGRQEDPPA